jgi:hypothetical protein
MDLLAESAIRITVLAFAVAVVLRALRICSPRPVPHAWTARPAPPSGSRVASAAAAGVALTIVCSAAVPAAAPAQDAPSQVGTQVAWPVETSEHFEIVHDDLSSDRVSDAVRDLEAAYAQLSAALLFDIPRRVLVILVRRDRDIAPDVGVSAGSGPTRIVLSLESLDRGTNTVVHELTHQFALEIIPEISRVSPVLIEGLAEHERGAWPTDDLRMVRTAAGAGAIPTLTALVNTDRHWAHAMFDFVDAQHGDDGVRRLLLALRAQDTLAQAVSMAFGLTLAQFEEQFRGYVTAEFGQP